MSEHFGYGYHIVSFDDCPPKVRMGEGERFFTNSRYGDLAILGKALLNGENISRASEIAGTDRRRASRFLNGLKQVTGKKILCRCGRETPHLAKCSERLIIKYMNQCKICKGMFQAHDKRQNKCKLCRRVLCQQNGSV